MILMCRVVFEETDAEYGPNITIPAVKYGKRSDRLGTVGSLDTFLLKVLQNQRAKCPEILGQILLSSFRPFKIGQEWVFQQDNNPKHIPKTKQKWLKKKHIQFIKWSSKFPDVSSLGNQWRELKLRLTKRPQRSKPFLYKGIGLFVFSLVSIQ